MEICAEHHVSKSTPSGTSAHSINVIFASAASLSTGTVTLGDGGTGTLKANNKTKSGYGITVSLPVTSSYVSGTTVTASYNFTSAKTVSLEYVNGTWQFPVNRQAHGKSTSPLIRSTEPIRLLTQ